MPRTRLVVALVSISLLLGLAACGGSSTPSVPTNTPTLTSTPAPATATPAPGQTPFPGGKDPVEGHSPGPIASELTDVRAASHDEEGGFDRITFEFATAARPSYRVEYITPPATGCGSGEPATIAGVAILHVRFANTNAHDLQSGQSTIDATEIAPGLPALLEAEQTCDFEAVVNWDIGLSAQVDFRVTELDNPPRIAVDVAHP
jgi:hypothetical protein